MRHEQLAELGIASVLALETAASAAVTWGASALAVVNTTEAPLGVPLTVALALSKGNERATSMFDALAAGPAETGGSSLAILANLVAAGSTLSPPVGLREHRKRRHVGEVDLHSW